MTAAMLAPAATRKRPLLLRLKRFLPRSLFGRTLLIIVVMTFIALTVATYVFFDRHWYTVTNRMTYAVAGDIATTIEWMHKHPSPQERSATARLAFDKMELIVSLAPGAKFEVHKHHHLNPLRDM